MSQSGDRRKRSKTQAFVPPKDTKTKNAVKHNSSTSFLRLPVEVRQRIWRHALGDRSIHIKFAPVRGPQDMNAGVTPLKSYLASPGSFTYIVCEATTSEVEAHSLFQSSSYNERVASGHEMRDQRICRKRHQDCYAHYDDCLHPSRGSGWDYYVGHPVDREEIRRNHLPLQLLRVCRQIYIEANRVLWGTNTWSFTHSRALYKFLNNRNPVQRRVLAKLHLDLDPRYCWKPESWAHQWSRVLNQSLLKKFSVVNTVHINITNNHWFRVDWASEELTTKPNLAHNMLLNLRWLAPKVLTITCTEMQNLADEWMKHSECVELAEDLHSKYTTGACR